MAAVSTWEWLLTAVFLVGSAFCSGTETALTALGDARARQLRDGGGRRARMLSLWIDHPERVLSTLLIGNTLVNVGAGALAGAIGVEIASAWAWNPASGVAAGTAVMTIVILFFGEIVPKTLAKRHPVRASLAAMPAARALVGLLWPVSTAVTRATSRLVRLVGADAGAAPAVTSEEIEYLIEMGTKEGVLDEVKEELLNSVLEFADRVAKEIMVPRTRVVAIDRDAPPDELVRVVTENPYSRMPVYQGSIDEVVGILLVREIVGEVRHGRPIPLAKYLKPPFFVPEQMKVSRLLKEMQRRRTHLAVVVDEFGGTSGIVTLEDVIEEIVGEIQDEGDVETSPVKAVAPGVWLADGGVPLHDLEGVLNEPPADGAADGGAPERREIRFPEQGDYETLGGFVTAEAGRVPPVGATVTWDGLTFTVRGGDERRVTKVEIARRDPDRARAGAAP
ncbi:MAG TPA: hemolysin family protein [Anaeromyxobacter sp.]|nr:hemolysin family protein [Anaeromyxobacter sp.]